MRLSALSQLYKSQVVRRIGADAALGVTCGVLFGMVFGGFTAIGKNDLYTMAFAPICIGGIGGIVVAVIGLFDGGDESVEEGLKGDALVQGESPESARERSALPFRQISNASPVVGVQRLVKPTTNVGLHASF